MMTAGAAEDGAAVVDGAKHNGHTVDDGTAAGSQGDAASEGDKSLIAALSAAASAEKITASLPAVTVRTNTAESKPADDQTQNGQPPTSEQLMFEDNEDMLEDSGEKLVIDEPEDTVETTSPAENGAEPTEDGSRAGGTETAADGSSMGEDETPGPATPTSQSAAVETSPAAGDVPVGSAEAVTSDSERKLAELTEGKERGSVSDASVKVVDSASVEQQPVAPVVSDAVCRSVACDQRAPTAAVSTAALDSSVQLINIPTGGGLDQPAKPVSGGTASDKLPAALSHPESAVSVIQTPCAISVPANSPASEVSLKPAASPQTDVKVAQCPQSLLKSILSPQAAVKPEASPPPTAQFKPAASPSPQPPAKPTGSPSPQLLGKSTGETPAAVVRERTVDGDEAQQTSAKKPRTETSGASSQDPAGLRTIELIESSLLKLKREVKALDLLARQKEREWDSLLKLRKAKEETFQRLRRKREVFLMQQSDESTPTVQQRPQSQPAVPPVTAAPAPAAAGPATSLPPSVSVAAVWAAQQQRQQHQQRAALAASLRSIRPAQVSPFSVAAAGGQPGAGQMGMGPLGPTISARHVIESQRAGGPGQQPPPPAEGSAFRRLHQTPAHSHQQQPLPPPAGPQDPHYREMLNQLSRLNKQLAGPTSEVTIHRVPPPPPPPSTSGASSDQYHQHQHQSSLAKLLMEKKKQVEPAVLHEMLKMPQSGIRASLLAGGLSHLPNLPVSSQPQQPVRPAAAPQPQPQPPPPPPPPPPSAGSDDVPVCQGCRIRQAQFVCAGCGNQWYCSRQCQVEAWDSHADECSG